MNVLTNPLLFEDLQGDTPPQWAVDGTYVFTEAGSVAQGILYVGASWKLPTSITMSVGTSAGAVLPSLVITVYAPSGDVETTEGLAANSTEVITFALAEDATSFKIGVLAGGDPWTDDIAIAITPVSAVDRVYAPNEIGRVMTAYVSAYQRDRVHVSNVYANQTARLTADFNGALNLDRALADATWQTYGTPQVFMSEPEITDKTASILVACGYAGAAVIKCTVTLDNGEKLVQQFRIDVLAQPYYTGDLYPSGPQSVTVTA